MLADEVVKLVVPSFQRFAQKMREKEFSKNPSKCESPLLVCHRPEPGQSAYRHTDIKM
ncbi:hypothetical protein BC826DRAFT_1084005, partial [Russula brevipes]